MNGLRFLTANSARGNDGQRFAHYERYIQQKEHALDEINERNERNKKECRESNEGSSCCKNNVELGGGGVQRVSYGTEHGTPARSWAASL